MKKIIIIISFTLFITSVLIFAFNFTFQKYSYGMLMSNHQEINVIFNDNKSQDDFINKLQQFSEKYHVNISQYTFLDEDTVHIYSTNLSVDPGLRLIDGDFPKGNDFISNKLINENNQSGFISFPPTQLDYRFYNIDQIKNVGLNGVFYVASPNQAVSKKLEMVLSPFGDVKTTDSSINPLSFVNITLLLMVLFTFITFFIVSLFYIFSERKMIYLSRLWGYTFKEVFINLLRPFFKPIIYILGAFAITLTVFIMGFKQTDYIFVYSVLFLSVIFVVLTIGIFIALLTLYMIFRLDISSVDLKGKLPFKNYAIASVIVKFIVTFVLLTINVFSINLLLDLNKQLNSNEYWKITEGVYRVNAKLPNTTENLSADRKLNNRLSDFYDALDEKKSAILIAAENFANVDTVGNESKYLYELNVTQDSNALISASGRNVVINKNYLDFNPIITTSGENAKDKVIYDSETLSLLVPEKLRKFEKDIERNFLNFFYFQRVEVANIYNEEMGQPFDKTTIDDLKLQIIYVKNNQEYFTLNTKFGDLNNNNLIVDPIAVIYQPTMDTSFISAYVTSSLYFIDNNNGEAYSSISEILKDTNTLSYIPSVFSVYQERGKEIADVIHQIYQQVATLVLMLIISICCIVIFTWCYYIPNAYTIYLHRLFGYSHWYSNKLLYLTIIITNIVSGIAVYTIFSSFITIYSSLVLLLLDITIIFSNGKILQRKHNSAILKGDQI